METKEFNVEDFKEVYIKSILEEVSLALKEQGYNPINQITGYLLSGDPGYISSFKDSRKRILTLKKEDIINELLKEYLKKCS